MILIVAALVCSPPILWAQANGKLQIHFIDVGQGDGALLVSPAGETVLFDDGVKGDCTKPVSYLHQLGVTKIDYHIASHYHADHIGCASDALAAFPLQKAAYDRGGSYNSAVFRAYASAAGTKRHTATEGLTITLDAASANPVTVKVVALNGNGISTTNENDLSLVALIKLGNFEAEIGGDPSGYKNGSYEDIESPVAPKVGQVEVYKVHHHCSAYSTNATWLETVQPRIGIISAGNGNSYGHPTAECLERLHNSGVKTYWTEAGAGAEPEADQDIVAGTVVVQFQPGASNFTVSYGAKTDQYRLWGATEPTTLRYAWSKNSGIYHYAECKYVARISPANLQRGDTPPPSKTLHQVCPQ
jgi:beta-lactamase superfamily II metal-dependent hydrolase